MSQARARVGALTRELGEMGDMGTQGFWYLKLPWPLAIPELSRPLLLLLPLPLFLAKAHAFKVLTTTASVTLAGTHSHP